MLPKHLQTVVGLARLCTVEPYLFCCLFGYLGRLVSFQSLIMDRSCRIGLGFSDAVCDDLDHHKTEQAESIEFGNNIYMGVMLSSSLPAALVAIFLGPWSDQYSRKWPLVLSAAGMALDAAAGLALAAMPHASPLWFVASAIFSGVSGGFIICTSAAFSYLSDVTDESSRPSRFAVLEFFSISAIVVGTLVGGQIYETVPGTVHTKLIAAMSVSPCCFLCAALYAAFVLRETKPEVPKDKRVAMLRDLIRVDNVKQSYSTCSKKRPGNLRMQIWMLVWISCSQKFADMGTLAVGYPFARKMYDWGVAAFSNASIAFYIVNAIVTLVVPPLLSNVLRLHEAAIGLIGTLSLIGKMVLTSVAYADYMFYVAWMSGTLANCLGIAVRSRLSKLVQKDELGRVFSVLGTCESMTPMLGSLVFLQIYNASVRTFPGMPFAVASVFLVPCALIFTWMLKMPTISLAEFARDLEEAKRTTQMEDMSTVPKSRDRVDHAVY